MVVPGSEPAPGSDVIGAAVPPPRCATSSARRRRSLTRRPAIRQNGTTSPASRRRYASRTSCKALSTRPPGRSARASGWDAQVATRSARPAMTPAWGPPRSLSPLNVTSAAPAARVWRAAGSPASHAGGPPGEPRAAGVQQSGADVGDDRRAVVAGRQPRQGGDRCVLDEALHAVVGRMDLEDQRDVRTRPVERAVVVGDARAVGRTHIDQAGARLFHHLRHPEATADLHALPRLTSTSRPRANAASTRSTADALLFTTSAALGSAEARPGAARNALGATPAHRCPDRAPGSRPTGDG